MNFAILNLAKLKQGLNLMIFTKKCMAGGE